jgi:ferrous iron transport protein B
LEESAFGRASATLTPALQPLGFGSWQAGGALISGLVAKEVVVSTLAQTYSDEVTPVSLEPTSFSADLIEIVTSFGQAVAGTIRAIPGLIGINLNGEEETTDAGLASALRADFSAASGGHAAAAGLAFMVFVLLYTPCMAAVAAERHEMGAKWAALSLAGQLAIAWLAAFAVFNAGVWLGGG